MTSKYVQGLYTMQRDPEGKHERRESGKYLSPDFRMSLIDKATSLHGELQRGVQIWWGPRLAWALDLASEPDIPTT